MPIPYLSAEYPLRFAHRGSRVLWPENTAEAFQGAVDLGYRYIETDVRISRDGVVVAFHDSTLQRTTNGTGSVDSWDFDDLRRLDAAWWFDEGNEYPRRGTGVRIRSLAVVFETWPDAFFNIDLKGPGLEWAVADVIKRQGREHSTLIGSFTDRRIAKFRRITHGEIAVSAGPAAVLAMVAASRMGGTVRRPVAAYQLPFDYKAVPIDRKLIDAIHRSGAQIHTWTVDEPTDMNRLLDLGVDGIVSDRPDILNEVLRERGHDV
ncbi:MAG: glycerophosphodiester phosphodiesterase [Acidimicrobiia bacterium]|nr:glycerophosphodiester phosphodiesterase [Acidimicrobiia bacterium]MDX2465759.1 glycerophosphodiester phosphodiesterase [Acidimicrobiia bacterium]